MATITPTSIVQPPTSKGLIVMNQPGGHRVRRESLKSTTITRTKSIRLKGDETQSSEAQQQTDADDFEEVSGWHMIIATQFDGNFDSQITIYNFEQVDEFLKGRDRIRDVLNYVEKVGKDGSFIHYILMSGVKFPKRLLLLQWVMQKYPELYKTPAPDGRSIFDIAATRCPLHFGSIVALYLVQLEDILQAAKNPGELLCHIMPYIRKSARAELLKFCGDTPIEKAPEKVRWPRKSCCSVLSTYDFIV